MCISLYNLTFPSYREGRIASKKATIMLKRPLLKEYIIFLCQGKITDKGKWEVLGQNEKVGIFESAVQGTLGKPGRHIKQVKHLKQVGGDRGFRVSPFPYHVLQPPILLCPFASRLPPFIVLLLSSG